MGIFLLSALGIGFVTGLRAMTGLAAVAWGAWLGWIRLDVLASPWTVGLLTLAALGELVADKLPGVPSRTSPGPFGARVVLGGLCGAGLGAASGNPVLMGALLGAAGAVGGTLGGFAYRVRFAPRFKVPDLPFALVEDIVAVGLGLFLVSRVVG